MKWFNVATAAMLATVSVRRGCAFAPDNLMKARSSTPSFGIIRHMATIEDATSTTGSETAERSPLGKPGTAQLDTPWEELGFEFRPTKSHVRVTFKDGEWGEPETVKVYCIHLNTRAVTLAIPHHAHSFLPPPSCFSFPLPLLFFFGSNFS